MPPSTIIHIDSHYVPRMHIYYFTEDRTFDKKHNPLSPVNVKPKGRKPYPTKSLSGICSIEDFYDKTVYSNQDSIENILATYETYFNKKIEKLRQGIDDGVNSDVIVSYISMMMSRSIELRNSIEDTIEELQSGSDPKDIQTLFILSGLDNLDGHLISDYKASILIAPAGEEYITSDVPVIKVNNCEMINKMGIDVDFSKCKGYEKEFVYICPLSSICCAIVYLKDSANCNSFVKDGRFYTVENINRMMSSQAIQYLFYAHKVSDECIKIFEDGIDDV